MQGLVFHAPNKPMHNVHVKDNDSVMKSSDIPKDISKENEDRVAKHVPSAVRLNSVVVGGCIMRHTPEKGTLITPRGKKRRARPPSLITSLTSVDDG